MATKKVTVTECDVCKRQQIGKPGPEGALGLSIERGEYHGGGGGWGIAKFFVCMWCIDGPYDEPISSSTLLSHTRDEW